MILYSRNTESFNQRYLLSSCRVTSTVLDFAGTEGNKQIPAIMEFIISMEAENSNKHFFFIVSTLKNKEG